MAGGTCNNQSRGAAGETIAVAMVTGGSGNNCENGNKGSSNDGKRAG